MHLLLASALAVILAAEPATGPLLNGKDLTGWKAKKGGESLDGQTEAYKGRFKLVNGELIIDPAVKGDVIIETAASFDGDLTLSFEFKPGPKCNNDLFFRGQKFDLKKPDVKNLQEDEWNQFEIVIVGESIEFRNNGESLKKAKTKPGATPLGIRAEFGPVAIRNLKITPASR